MGSLRRSRWVDVTGVMLVENDTQGVGMERFVNIRYGIIELLGRLKTKGTLRHGSLCKEFFPLSPARWSFRTVRYPLY